MNFDYRLYLSNKTLLSVGLFSLFFLGSPPVEADDFIEDASVTGHLFSWNRDRETKTGTAGKYIANLRHATLGASLDAKSGYFSDLFSVEFGGYGIWDAINSGTYHPNDASFSQAHTLWDENHTADTSGVSFYKMQMNFKLGSDAWLKAGYIQPSGDTLLKTQWNLLPATYRGAELGSKLDLGHYGTLSSSYMWADQYKDPWYRDMYGFRYGTKGNYHDISYLHSLGFKYDFNKNFIVKAAFGQAHNYMNQYFTELVYKKSVSNHPLLMNYQFYGAQDQNHVGDKAYDGLAWMQVVSLKYTMGPVELRADGKIIQADGNQGYFLKRMTPTLDSSEGVFDAWWDLRSNFNANGERVLYAQMSYDLSDLNDKLKGLTTSASAAYGWNAKPNSKAEYDQSVRINELGWSLGLDYHFYDSMLKGTKLKFYYINYSNNSSSKYAKNIGFGNIYPTQYELRFTISVPFTIFNPAEK